METKSGYLALVEEVDLDQWFKHASMNPSLDKLMIQEHFLTTPFHHSAQIFNMDQGEGFYNVEVLTLLNARIGGDLVSSKDVEVVVRYDAQRSYSMMVDGIIAKMNRAKNMERSICNDLGVFRNTFIQINQLLDILLFEEEVERDIESGEYEEVVEVPVILEERIVRAPQPVIEEIIEEVVIPSPVVTREIITPPSPRRPIVKPIEPPCPKPQPSCSPRRPSSPRRLRSPSSPRAPLVRETNTFEF